MALTNSHTRSGKQSVQCPRRPDASSSFPRRDFDAFTFQLHQIFTIHDSFQLLLIIILYFLQRRQPWSQRTIIPPISSPTESLDSRSRMQPALMPQTFCGFAHQLQQIPVSIHDRTSLQAKIAFFQPPAMIKHCFESDC